MGRDDEESDDEESDEDCNLDDSIIDPNWKESEANFNLAYQSDSSDDDVPLVSRRKSGQRVHSRVKNPQGNSGVPSFSAMVEDNINEETTEMKRGRVKQRTKKFQ